MSFKRRGSTRTIHLRRNHTRRSTGASTRPLDSDAINFHRLLAVISVARRLTTTDAAVWVVASAAQQQQQRYRRHIAIVTGGGCSHPIRSGDNGQTDNIMALSTGT